MFVERLAEVNEAHFANFYQHIMKNCLEEGSEATVGEVLCCVQGSGFAV